MGRREIFKRIENLIEGKVVVWYMFWFLFEGQWEDLGFDPSMLLNYSRQTH